MRIFEENRFKYIKKFDPLDEPKSPVIPLASMSLEPNKTVTVYLNPNADCGKLVNTDKFHLSHTQFGSFINGKYTKNF